MVWEASLKGVRWVVNPEYKELQKQLELETALVTAKKRPPAPETRFTGIYQNQYGGTATSAEGTFSGWLNDLLGSEGDGGMAAIFSKMNLDAPAEGVDPMYLTGDLPGASQGRGYDDGPPGVFMSEEMKERRARDAVNAESMARVTEERRLQAVVANFFAAPATRTTEQIQINNIQGSYIASTTAAAFMARSGNVSGASAALAAAQARRAQGLYNVRMGLPVGASGLGSP